MAKTSAGAASSFSLREPAQAGRHLRVDARDGSHARAGAASARFRTGGRGLRPLPRSRPRCRAARGRRRGRATAKPGNRRSRNSPIVCSTGRKRCVRPRQADKAVDRGRDLDQRLQPLIVSLTRSSSRAEAETAIGDERKRVRRVHRQRGQHREDVGHEMVFEPGAVAGFEIGRLDDGDPLGGQVPAARPARSTCWSSISLPARLWIASSCWAGVSPSWLTLLMPAMWWPLSPATRTM